MTDREAIARFEPYIGNECYRKEFQEACALAISAIKEREERSKGCEYCADHKYNVEDCVMLSHDKSDFDSGMYIYDGELISNSGEFQCVRINFCPMCGRPLKGADND